MLTQESLRKDKAVCRLKDLSEDERVRLLIESREKWEWDIQAILEKGLEKGLEEGFEKGLLSFAHTALKKNLPIEHIMAMTGFPKEKILSLQH